MLSEKRRKHLHINSDPTVGQKILVSADFMISKNNVVKKLNNEAVLASI